MSRGYGLRDDQWAKIEHLLPGRKGSVAALPFLLLSSSLFSFVFPPSTLPSFLFFFLKSMALMLRVGMQSRRSSVTRDNF